MITCEREPTLMLGEFVEEWGRIEGAKNYFCSIKVGCKGPIGFITGAIIRI